MVALCYTEVEARRVARLLNRPQANSMIYDKSNIRSKFIEECVFAKLC